MAAATDKQWDLAFFLTTALPITTTPGTSYTTSVDLSGMVSFGATFQLASALDSADEVRIIIQDSDDDSTFSAISDEKYLPTRRKGNHILVNPALPYYQTTGAFSLRRYVRIGLQVVSLVAGQTVQVRAYAKPDSAEFVGWDPTASTGDGQP